MEDCPIDPDLPVRLFIDSNRINARKGLPHMNRLTQWAAKDWIEIMLTESVFQELAQAGLLQRREASKYIRTLAEPESAEDRARLKSIERIIFPDGADTDSKRLDALHVYSADYYLGIFVTGDGLSKSQPRGILGAASDLAAQLDIRVMSDEQACAEVEYRKQIRDEQARLWAKMNSRPVPSFVDEE